MRKHARCNRVWIAFTVIALKLKEKKNEPNQTDHFFFRRFSRTVSGRSQLRLSVGWRPTNQRPPSSLLCLFSFLFFFRSLFFFFPAKDGQRNQGQGPTKRRLDIASPDWWSSLLKQKKNKTKQNKSESLFNDRPRQSCFGITESSIVLVRHARKKKEKKNAVRLRCHVVLFRFVLFRFFVLFWTLLKFSGQSRIFHQPRAEVFVGVWFLVFFCLFFFFFQKQTRPPLRWISSRHQVHHATLVCLVFN